MNQPVFPRVHARVRNRLTRLLCPIPWLIASCKAWLPEGNCALPMNAHAQLLLCATKNCTARLALAQSSSFTITLERMAIPASVPNFVAGWTSRPMPFNAKKRGERAQLSNKNAAVERIDPETHDDGCLVYTACPLPLGCLWNMTLTTTNGISRGMVSEGCMNTYPYVL